MRKLKCIITDNLENIFIAGENIFMEKIKLAAKYPYTYWLHYKPFFILISAKWS